MRKTPILSLVLVFILTLTCLFSACKKDDDWVDTNNNNNNNPPTTSTINFEIRKGSTSGDSIPGAIISLGTSPGFFTEGDILVSQNTDQFGKAKFSNLTIEMYFINVAATYQGSNLRYQGSINLALGSTVNKLVVVN